MSDYHKTKIHEEAIIASVFRCINNGLPIPANLVSKEEAEAIVKDAESSITYHQKRIHEAQQERLKEELYSQHVALQNVSTIGDDSFTQGVGV